jgi:hypothetical protein
MTLAVNIPRGTTHDIKVTVTAKNLTGATALCTFVTAHGVTATLVKRSSDGGITVAGATNSLVTVHLLPADAATLTGGPYLYTLQTTLSGVVEVIEDGTLTLTANDAYGVS